MRAKLWCGAFSLFAGWCAAVLAAYESVALGTIAGAAVLYLALISWQQDMRRVRGLERRLSAACNHLVRLEAREQARKGPAKLVVIQGGRR